MNTTHILKFHDGWFRRESVTNELTLTFIMIVGLCLKITLFLTF